MVFFPAFNVSMFIWSWLIVAPFSFSRSVAFISYDVTYGTYFGSVWDMVLSSLSVRSVQNPPIRSMILS